MNGRQFLTFVAATLITVGQTLVFATDTAASADALLGAVANPAPASSVASLA